MKTFSSRNSTSWAAGPAFELEFWVPRPSVLERRGFVAMNLTGGCEGDKSPALEKRQGRAPKDQLYNSKWTYTHGIIQLFAVIYREGLRSRATRPFVLRQCCAPSDSAASGAAFRALPHGPGAPRHRFCIPFNPRSARVHRAGGFLQVAESEARKFTVLMRSSPPARLR